MTEGKKQNKKKWQGNLIKTNKACELRFPHMKLKMNINKTKIKSMKFLFVVELIFM